MGKRSSQRRNRRRRDNNTTVSETQMHQSSKPSKDFFAESLSEKNSDKLARIKNDKANNILNSGVNKVSLQYSIGKSCDNISYQTNNYEDAKKHCTDKLFVFDNEGIRVWPKPPMSVSARCNEYYRVGKSLSKSKDDKKFLDLGESIRLCILLGQEYNVYDHYNNRVF